jgi:Carboxypeptidase regulatory-like domain
MMTRRIAYTAVAFLLIAAAVLYWWWRFHNHDSSLAHQSTRVADQAPVDGKLAGLLAEATEPLPSNTPDNESHSAQKKAFMAIFQTPISFWGRVVDEKGNGVPNAAVVLIANDEPYGKGAKYQRTTDSRGLFSITEIHGMSLNVEVSKDGYYQTAESRGSTIYAIRGKSDRPVPTSENPAIFFLRRRGGADQLYYVSVRPINLRKDGTPVTINLETGKSVPAEQGHLRVECWTEDQKKDAQGHYPWRCRVSVIGGGLIKRKDEYNFLAPADGYQPQDDITPPKERWSPTAEREYFIKTADSSFARVKLRIRTGGDHLLVIESYFNPKPGERNLEYDPNKQEIRGRGVSVRLSARSGSG